MEGLRHRALALAALAQQAPDARAQAEQLAQSGDHAEALGPGQIHDSNALTLAALALALRFVPYSDDRGNLHPAWTAIMAACFVVAIAASAYLVYVLEILKLRRLRAWQLRRTDPDTTEHEIDREVERELETGEFTALG